MDGKEPPGHLERGVLDDLVLPSSRKNGCCAHGWGRRRGPGRAQPPGNRKGPPGRKSKAGVIRLGLRASAQDHRGRADRRAAHGQRSAVGAVHEVEDVRLRSSDRLEDVARLDPGPDGPASAGEFPGPRRSGEVSLSNEAFQDAAAFQRTPGDGFSERPPPPDPGSLD